MKRIFFILTVLFFVACTGGTDPGTFDEHAGHSHEEELKAADEQQDLLVLNDGNKWKVDANTGKNIKEIEKIIADFKTINAPSTEDYQELNGALARALNKTIQQCTMTGADHDALHYWMAPILKENPKLKDITTAEKSKATFDLIDNRIQLYHQYFE